MRKLVARKSGVLLDLSFGGTPQPNSLSLSPHGDIRRSPIALPFPLADGAVHTCVVTHVLEFLPQDQFFAWFDELHRIVRPKGICYLSGPYGGDESVGWLSDPSHKTRIIEDTFAWLDPRTPIYQHGHALAGRQKPQPWAVLMASRVPGTVGTISYNITIQKLDKKDYEPS